MFCDLKPRRLTKTPAANAADALMIESYGKVGKVVLGLLDMKLPDR
jgi:hypothetical protein